MVGHVHRDLCRGCLKKRSCVVGHVHRDLCRGCLKKRSCVVGHVHRKRSLEFVGSSFEKRQHHLLCCDRHTQRSHVPGSRKIPTQTHLCLQS